ncbi:tail completion protein gp17 [Sphingomonas silueang]|uniref:tail completion protein gp17 n=1 Tax=Sphingomonas silueang TaxID=3156617 RepID=UPI0032B58D7C
MSDPIGALVAALAADAVVAGLAGSDVYGGELPEDAVARMPIRTIVIQASGGSAYTSDSDANVDAQRVDLIAYAATAREADQLRAAGARVLRGIRRQTIGGTLIHWVNSAGGFSAGRDRDGTWPRSFQSFQIFYALGE